MKRSSSAIPLIVIIISLLLLSACGQAPSEPTSVSEVSKATDSTLQPEPTVTQPTEIPTEVPIPTPTLFVPKATIKIVSQSPVSNSWGKDLGQGIELAIEQLAGPLMEMGYKVEFVAYDDQGSVEASVTNAKELIADPEVLCGVGHLYSYLMIQASEYYHKAGLAFVSPSTTSSNVNDRGYLEVNRIVGRNDIQGMAAAQFAKAQDLVNVFIIGTHNDYSQELLTNFKTEAKKLGLKMVGNVTTDETENFGAIIEKVIASNPDIIFFASDQQQGGTFFREARATGYMGTFLGPDYMDSSQLLEKAGPLLIEGGGMYYIDMAVPAGLLPDATQFVQDYQNNYGEAPQLVGGGSYDAAGICLKAIENASKAKNGELPTRAEVANAVRLLENYKGITGTYTLNKNGDPILARYYILKVITADPTKWNENTLVTTLEIAPPE